MHGNVNIVLKMSLQKDESKTDVEETSEIRENY